QSRGTFHRLKWMHINLQLTTRTNNKDNKMGSDELWAAGKAAIQVFIVPAIGFIFYIFKKNERRMEMLERGLATTKSDLAVLDERVSNVKEDISEIKALLHEI